MLYRIGKLTGFCCLKNESCKLIGNSKIDSNRIVSFKTYINVSCRNLHNPSDMVAIALESNGKVDLKGCKCKLKLKVITIKELRILRIGHSRKLRRHRNRLNEILYSIHVKVNGKTVHRNDLVTIYVNTLESKNYLFFGHSRENVFTFGLSFDNGNNIFLDS